MISLLRIIVANYFDFSFFIFVLFLISYILLVYYTYLAYVVYYTHLAHIIYLGKPFTLTKIKKHYLSDGHLLFLYMFKLLYTFEL